jgi:hypothetical protein
MDEQLLSSLLDELKSLLRITWNDEDTDLKGIIKRAEAYLSELTGASFDFQKEQRPKELLFERCRYIYNNAADEFEDNFHGELSRLILNVALGKVGVLPDETI